MLRTLLSATLALCCAFAQPPAPESILRQAIVQHQSGDIEGAIRNYREYLKRRPESLEARSNLGAALARAGRFDEAIAEYNQALERSSGNPQVLLNLALAYYKTARFAEAAPRFEAALAVAPNRQAAWLLADCEIHLGEYKKAVERLAPYENESSGDPAFNYLYGTALIRDQQAARGAAVIDRILRQGDSAEARLLLGTTKMFANDYAGAMPDLKKAVELNPKLPEAHAYYGQSLLRTGDQAGAAVEFRRELALNPTDFMSNLQMGVLTRQDQDYTASRQYLERALRSRPGDPGVRYQLATVDLATGNVEGAKSALEKLVAESPQFTEAHVSLATVYYRLKRKEDGDRERAIVRELTEAAQATQPGVNVK
jgi:Flp pilus assembly protein TadD